MGNHFFPSLAWLLPHCRRDEVGITGANDRSHRFLID